MAKDESINKVRDIYNPDGNELAQSIIRDLFNYFNDGDLEDFVNFLEKEYGVEPPVEDEEEDEEEDWEDEDEDAFLGKCFYMDGMNRAICGNCDDVDCLNSGAYEKSQQK